ncbi:MAG: hypothetical protein ABI885_17840 [Gammaproteobacteria bacterium]
MPRSKVLKPTLVAAVIALALFLFEYVPVSGAIGYLLVPTAILVGVALLAAGVFGRSRLSRVLIGCGLFVVVALAGLWSRWADTRRVRETYAVHETFTTPLKITFGAPIQSYAGPKGVVPPELSITRVLADLRAFIALFNGVSDSTERSATIIATLPERAASRFLDNTGSTRWRRAGESSRVRSTRS